MINILFLAMLFLLFASLRRRHKRRNDSLQGKTPEAPAPPQAADRREKTGYDYAAFRKRLKQAWAEESGADGSGKEKPSPAESLPEEETAEKTSIPPGEAPEASIPQSAERAPVPAPEPAAGQGKELPSPSSSGRTEKAACPAAEVPGPGVRWSEADVEKWAVYDAVLGEPRSRRPWTPPGKSR